ncbi:MAG TPA: sigma-70 family RNA polymerase sigma factor [Thermomicrobiales bacterium]|nr:sigma-70 family RNA polymerase sigma factor [Thermomicrobiales bacterium]
MHTSTEPLPFPARGQPVAGSAPQPSPEDLQDERLIRAAQAGDLDSFNQLVVRHESAVFSVCLRLLRDGAQAEDAAQDTFIRAWSAIESFRGGLVRPWLLRIATNRAYDILRARSRRPTWSLDAEPFEIEPEWTSQASDESPETFATRSELASVLESALAGLPEDQRVAILLSDVQGYGYDDIASMTGVAIGTVKSRISRGRSALRTILRDSTEHRELFERYVRLSTQEGGAG